MGSTGLKAQTEVQFYTSLGNFKVLLYDSVVPITAGNFIYLVNQKYYDGVIFHRVIDGFMIQGGDPTGTGSGGPGYSIDDEFDSTLSNVQKTISMANSGPNTGGSQFFINLVNNTYLDFNKAPLSSKHPVFGVVTDSFEVVQRIGKVSTNIQNRPHTPVVMDSIRVIIKEPIKSLSDETVQIHSNILDENSTLYYQVDPTETFINPQNRIDIKCYNNKGEVMWLKEVYARNNTTKLSISLTELWALHLPKGLYYIRTNTTSKASKIVVL